MIVFGSASLAEKRRRQVVVDGSVFHKSEWLESGQDPTLSPTVFLVEQPPDTKLQGHFHGENQFQVFVKGEGRMGTHAISPITVHYAGAYSGYGPLFSGPEGLAYFTIRAVFETGKMSSSDPEKMVRGPKRHCVTAPKAPAEAATLAVLAEIETEELIALQPDGIAARILRLPSGGRITGFDPATGGGQFYLVLNGELLHGNAVLRHWESMFVSSDETAISISAGASGLEVLCLQMAPKDPIYVAAKLASTATLPAGVL